MYQTRRLTILFLILFLLSGCSSKTTEPGSGTQTTSSILSAELGDVISPSGSSITYIPPYNNTVNGIKCFSAEEKRLCNLNLDGIGILDDCIIASNIRIDNGNCPGMVVIKVVLGDGRSAYQCFTGLDYMDLRVGYITTESQQSVVLALTNCISNFQATEFHVLNIAREESNNLPFLDEKLTILNDDYVDLEKGTQIVDQLYLFPKTLQYKNSLFQVKNPECSQSQVAEYITSFTNKWSLSQNPETGLDIIKTNGLINQELISVDIFWNGSEWESKVSHN